MQTIPGAPTFSIAAPLSQTTVDTSFTMDAVDLDTPMSTLRNIASMSKEAIPKSYNMTYDPIFPVITREERQAFEQDPVAQGLLTMEEAQEAFDMSAKSRSASDPSVLADLLIKSQFLLELSSHGPVSVYSESAFGSLRTPE
jgi:hypothetical protein